MRFLVTVHVPTDASDAFVKDPSFGEKLQTLLAEHKAECVYFGGQDGGRSVIYVTDLKDASHMSEIAEPWRRMVKARVDAVPVFTPYDMQQAASDVFAIAKNWE